MTRATERVGIMSACPRFLKRFVPLLSTLSMTMTSTGALAGSSFNPSCCWKAVNRSGALAEAEVPESPHAVSGVARARFKANCTLAPRPRDRGAVPAQLSFIGAVHGGNDHFYGRTVLCHRGRGRRRWPVDDVKGGLQLTTGRWIKADKRRLKTKIFYRSDPRPSAFIRGSIGFFSILLSGAESFRPIARYFLVSTAARNRSSDSTSTGSATVSEISSRKSSR
jgi:hypothetical protein